MTAPAALDAYSSHPNRTRCSRNKSSDKGFDVSRDTLGRYVDKAFR